MYMQYYDLSHDDIIHQIDQHVKKIPHRLTLLYRIVGKFGEDLNLAILRVVGSWPNLIPCQIF